MIAALLSAAAAVSLSVRHAVCVCGCVEDAFLCAELCVLSFLTAFLLQHAFVPAANSAFL